MNCFNFCIFVFWCNGKSRATFNETLWYDVVHFNEMSTPSNNNKYRPTLRTLMEPYWFKYQSSKQIRVEKTYWSKWSSEISIKTPSKVATEQIVTWQHYHYLSLNEQTDYLLTFLQWWVTILVLVSHGRTNIKKKTNNILTAKHHMKMLTPEIITIPIMIKMIIWHSHVTPHLAFHCQNIHTYYMSLPHQ